MYTFYPIQDVNRWVSQVRFGGLILAGRFRQRSNRSVPLPYRLGYPWYG